MRYVLALFFTIFVILANPIAVFASFASEAPPDYKKSGNLAHTYACDEGKTTVRVYMNQAWKLGEIRTTGTTLVQLKNAAPEPKDFDFFVQPNGAPEMKKVTHEEFDAVLEKEAPSAYRSLHGLEPNDCKRQQ